MSTVKLNAHEFSAVFHHVVQVTTKHCHEVNRKRIQRANGVQHHVVAAEMVILFHKR